jgi:hypothetical protein
MPGERYGVQLTRKAEKDLDGYRGLTARVVDELLVLEEDPTRGHTLTGSLRGCRALEFSLPDGAHRAAYEILNHEHICLVFMVGPHENFYREAERRAAALRKAGEF